MYDDYKVCIAFDHVSFFPFFLQINLFARIIFNYSNYQKLKNISNFLIFK